MSLKTDVRKDWTLASVALLDAWTDFMLSRQAMQCSPVTVGWYGHTSGEFLTWLESPGVNAPAEIGARHVRMYFAMRDSTDGRIPR